MAKNEKKVAYYLEECLMFLNVPAFRFFASKLFIVRKSN